MRVPALCVSDYYCFIQECKALFFKLFSRQLQSTFVKDNKKEDFQRGVESIPG